MSHKKDARLIWVNKLSCLHATKTGFLATKPHITVQIPCICLEICHRCIVELLVIMLLTSKIKINTFLDIKL